MAMVATLSPPVASAAEEDVELRLDIAGGALFSDTNVLGSGPDSCIYVDISYWYLSPLLDGVAAIGDVAWAPYAHITADSVSVFQYCESGSRIWTEPASGTHVFDGSLRYWGVANDDAVVERAGENPTDPFRWYVKITSGSQAGSFTRTGTKWDASFTVNIEIGYRSNRYDASTQTVVASATDVAVQSSLVCPTGANTPSSVDCTYHVTAAP